MSKVTMPETVGYQWLDTGHFRKKIPKGCDVSAFRALVTVDQAKAYAEARVREALEMAAQEVELTHSNSDDQDRFQKCAAEAIRALIK